MAKSVNIRIFYSLLFISLLEASIWCVPLFDDNAGVQQIFTSYYDRETENFKGASQSISGLFVSALLTGVCYAGLELASKEEQLLKRKFQSTLLATQSPADSTSLSALPLTHRGLPSLLRTFKSTFQIP
ncbi:hypothetical protein CYMTET_5526 [Cymbomonas tetramitiformis]|uniref:Uncharacterized protein n=1 Tax=Cymbomonas tetramitiformis TaxID=36881 RepID=A0AAE0GYZ9_9CHLO|nr:hypothetical protein CYMTET_5526 [Cymbomonas tetramitiformis]